MKKSGRKNKTSKVNFEAPKIIGIISDQTIPAPFEKSLNREISKIGLPYVCLPFKIEKRFLRNVLSCMQIMDIEGLVIRGSHSNLIGKYLSNLDESARKKGRVNIIKRSRNRFKGYHIEQKPLFFLKVVNILTSK